jgi:H+/gluconate symporter-like permease
MLLAIIGIIILLMLIMKTKIEIAYLENKFSLKFIFLGVIKINFKAKTKVVKGVKSKKIDFKILIETIYNSLNVFTYLLSKIELSIKINCVFFAYSADKTAIIYGLINSILYPIHAVLCKKLKKHNGIYNFKPDLNNYSDSIKIKFTTEDKISIRNIHILITVCMMLPKLLIYMKKIKNKRRKLNESSNRRFNENYNG